jgi:hypothetical protein
MLRNKGKMNHRGGTIVNHAYDVLKQVAEWRDTTPEALLESLVSEQLPTGFARNETEFFHALGFDDTQIADSTERMSHLPDAPDW